MHLLKFLLTLQILCFCTVTIIAQPAQEWFTSHNGTGSESHGHFILSCSDGGFLQVGETGFIPNSAKVLVVKTDASGNLLWKKEFGSTGHNLGNSAYEISDGYLICGALNQNSAFIKLNKINGNTIFSKTYNNGGSDAIEHVAATPSGFLAVGYVNALDPNNTFYTEGAGYLMLLDAAGNKINGININAYTSHAYRIKEYGGALFVSGLSAGAEEYNLMKFDFSGTPIWHKTFGGNSDDHCFGMDINSAGEIFLTGHTISGTQNWDTYTLKINSNGTLIWEKKTGNPRGFDPRYIHDEAWGVKATNDGGCVVIAGTGDEYAAYSVCNSNGCSDVWRTYFIKYDANGTVEWQETYFTNNSIDWAGEDVDLTSDGGAIIAVDDGTFGFLKIAPFSNTGPDIDMDGVPDQSDNCLNTANPNQENGDGDSFGAACDCNDANPNDAHLTIDNQPIPSGTYGGNITLSSVGTISAGSAMVTFQAGESISLLPGFIAEQGSEFLAQITSCNSTPAPVVGEDEVEMERVSHTSTLENIEIKNTEATLLIAPNPVSNSTTLQYNLLKTSKVHVQIFDAIGHLHKIYLNGAMQTAGPHQVEINVSHFPAGVYVVVLTTEDQMISKKMIVSK